MRPSARIPQLPASRIGRTALLACALAAGCPAKTAQTRPDAREQPTEAQRVDATRKLAQARQAEQEGRELEALALYQAVAREYPRTAEEPQALLAAGELAVRLKQPEAARAALEQLALNHPGHPHARRARMLLGALDVEAGRPEGLPAMRAELEQYRDPEERRKAAKEYGIAAVRMGQRTAAIDALGIAENLTPEGPEKTELRTMLVDLTDHGLKPQEALALREGAAPGSFARTLLTLKLGRIYLHIGEDRRAGEELKAFIGAAPADSPFVASAQQLLKALEERMLVAPRRLGVVLPLTGKYEQTGQRMLAALKLGLQASIDEAIARGQTTPPPSPVELVVEDDQSSDDEAARAMERLVQEQKVMAVVGAITIQGSKDAAIRAEALKVPLLTLARREGLAEMGPWTFQMALTDERQAREVARMAFNTLGFKRVALMYPRLPRGVALINAFWDEYETLGGAIAGAESYDHDETTFKVPIRKLVGRHHLDARYEYVSCIGKTREIEQAYKRQKAQEACRDGLTPVVDFEALFIADYHGPVGLIAPALAFEDVFVGNDERALRAFKQTTGRTAVRPVVLLGTNGFNDRSLPTRGGKYVQGALFVDGFSPNDGRPETLSFLKAFNTATGGGRAELREAQAYDAGRILGLVFGGVPQSRDEFRDRLGAVRDFPGVTGPTSFDAQGSSLTPLHVFTIKGESIVPAQPERKSGG